MDLTMVCLCDQTIIRENRDDCPRQEIHQSDQGVQYVVTAFVTMLREAGVAISMAEVGEPEQNGYAGCLMRPIKEEHVDLTEYGVCPKFCVAV